MPWVTEDKIVVEKSASYMDNEVVGFDFIALLSINALYFLGSPACLRNGPLSQTVGRGLRPLQKNRLSLLNVPAQGKSG